MKDIFESKYKSIIEVFERMKNKKTLKDTKQPNK
jgi:hypothetical protein